MDRSLLSLCLVNTLWHKYKKTYVDNFVPLLTTTLMKYHYHKVENDNIQSLMDNFFADFGISLTQAATLTILQKCKKKGVVRRLGKSYYINEEAASKFDISNDLEINTRKQNRLLADFKEFYKSETGETISDDVVLNLVLSFIKNNDVGLFLFSDSNEANLLPEPKLPHDNKRYKYLFNKYISKIYSENKEIFRILIEIALGSIATNALLFSFSNQTSQSIKDCEIYLDTSLILQLIGADEKEISNSVSLLLDSINSNGAKLKIYTHTYDECQENLEASLNWVESINFDPVKANRTSLFFRQEGYKKSDIELIIASLDRVLKEKGILVEQAPSYTYETTLIDEKRLQAIFEEEIIKKDRSFQAANYKRRTLRDIASICATSRLRYGIRHIQTIKDAKYIFVTTNGALSFANYRYNKEAHRNRRNEMLECVSDVFLGTYLWINTPQIADMVNSFKIMAVALSAIKPDPEMEAALKNEAKKLLDRGNITKDDYFMVTSSHLIKDLLSDRYFANASIITESSLYGMLDEIKERIIGEQEVKIDEVNKRFYEEKQKREEVEKKATEDKKRYDSMIVALETTAKVNADRKSKKKVIILKILLFLMIVTPLIPAFFVSKLLLIISGLFAGISVLSSVLGYTFNSINEGIYNCELQKEREKLQLESIEQHECENA
jgi:hypothetical protein